MTLRPLAAVTLALACAFATPSTAGGNVALDGVRRTNAVVRGSVSEPAFVASERLVNPIDPTREECGPTSCDITLVRLTLPKGTTAGRFRTTVTMPRTLNGYVAMYNREGEEVGRADIVQSGEPVCCDPELTSESWKATFIVPRLAAGTYSLVVFDRGGLGEFTADIEFRAYPPDRQPPSRKG